MMYDKLSAKEFKEVLQEKVLPRATGIELTEEAAKIKRSGLTNYFMYELITGIEIAKNFAIIDMGHRPYCIIKIALKHAEPWEL